MLWLNNGKTEFLLIGSRQQLAKVSIDSIKVGDADIAPVSSARNLGTWFDSHMDMSTRISLALGSLSRACYAWFIGVRRGTCGGRGVAVGRDGAGESLAEFDKRSLKFKKWSLVTRPQDKERGRAVKSMIATNIKEALNNHSYIKSFCKFLA